MLFFLANRNVEGESKMNSCFSFINMLWCNLRQITIFTKAE